ncbi:hypothetical protein Ccrd_012978 [Cynara cardunculus var. scolymus]|uniref:Uncharacterized protein n=1 Tax=Cynara cardunculus var. scolymus TaxID=59895 RepID=A0A103YGI4_CYNCS|nr:hypothetical protein Ccrd_012978 [Cynara cardunculus var. scolymus]
MLMVYEELDDAKAEIEKLRSEYHVKANLCDNLKRSYDDQVKTIQELNQKLENQAREIEAKSDENYAAKQSLEDLKCKLKEKECIIKSFSSSNDKLRVDFNSKLRESEEEKKELASSLEEANVKILNLEHENRAFMDKIEVLKEGILSVSNKKCASESKMAKACKQIRENGDMFEKLEEEKAKLEEKLKWKNEQFKYLEEAHEKLRDNLRTKEKEWDMEKSTCFDEISTLETKLDSQIRLSEDFKRRLQICNRSLAHEEDQRKSLVVKLQLLTNGKDEDIGILRNLLSEKECVYKEMESKIGRLEEENQELVFSLKELRRAGNSSSVGKLRNKLKTLEQVHSECSHQSKLREAEWSSQFDKVVADLNVCRLELESKEARLKEITTELNGYNSRMSELTMEKEESAIMMVAMKSTLLEARSKIDEEKVLVLRKELESKNCDLVKAHESIKEQLAEIESLKMIKHKEIESHEEQLKNVCDLLDRSNKELDWCCCEATEVEFELQIWKSVAERLEANLEQNHRMRREVEASLLAQVATEVDLKQEIDNLVCGLEEKEKRIKELEQKLKESNRFGKENGEKLEKEIEWWEQEWVTKELEAAILAQLESERLHEHEKQSLNQLVEEKDERIKNLRQIMKCLEEEFDDSSASFSCELGKMQAEMKLFLEAWENMRTFVVLKEIEVQEKGLMVMELEKDLEFEKKCVEKVLLEKEKLMDIIGGVSERINKLSREDGQVMRNLRSIMLSFHEFDPVKENTNVYQSPKRNTSLQERSPLRALNG